METLEKIFLRILLEQNASGVGQDLPHLNIQQPVSQQTPAPSLPTDTEIEKYDTKNLSLSIFKNDKRFLFSKIIKDKPPKFRGIINQIKNLYKVKSIKPLNNDSFEVFLDPRENFGVVVDFVKKEATK